MAENPDLRGPFEVDIIYTYTYDDATDIGDLLREGNIVSKFFVRKFRLNVQREGDKYRHVNLLKCITVDTGQGNLIYEWFERLVLVKACVDKWCKHKAFREPIMGYLIPSRPGINKKWTCYLAPVARSVIRQLYTFVNYQHRHGNCISRFTLQDLWMNGDVLKVSNVGIGLEDDAQVRKENFQKNFVWIIQVIKDLVGPETKAYPYSNTLKHLIKTSKELDGLDVKKEKLLVNHLAILPPPQFIRFIRACGKEFHNYYEDPNVQVLDEVPYTENWKNKFIGEEKEAFHYIKECFEHKDTNLTVQEYAQDGCPLLVKSSLLRFARNIAVHLRVKSRMVLDDVHLETIILFFFHEHLLAVETACLTCSQKDSRDSLR